jgi:hypothetical protein
MDMTFNSDLAEGMRKFNELINAAPDQMERFKASPTETLKQFLSDRRVEIPDPQTFHAHAINSSEPLPQEPERATIDRFIYVYRKSGVFEYKVVPGSKDGNDDIMINPTGACCCCNCGCFEVA